MYEDSPRKRYLMRDGTSFVDEFVFVEKSIRESITPNTRIIAGEDSDTYKLLFGEDIGKDPDTCLDPVPPSHEHGDSDIAALLDILEASPRYEQTSVNDNRIEKELDFFDRTKNILFLLKVHDMVERFKLDGVVWGVGRGSSCSSYILYLLEAHDVNPITFDIPFSELSKEQD